MLFQAFFICLSENKNTNREKKTSINNLFNKLFIFKLKLYLIKYSLLIYFKKKFNLYNVKSNLKKFLKISKKLSFSQVYIESHPEITLLFSPLL